MSPRGPAAGSRGLALAGRGLAVVGLVVGLLLTSAPAAPARAAEDELALVTSASYRLDPEAAVVRVVVDVTATNNKPNRVEQTAQGTRTTRYFYEAAAIVVHAEADAIAATTGGRALTTSVDREEGFTVVEVRFRTDLYYQQSTEFTLTYDLPGGAPRSASDIRVGAAFATFYAWAFGDRGDVRITIPGGFEVETTGSTIAEADIADGSAYAATGISNVAEWYVVVVADRHDALTREPLDMEGGERLLIRSWPEDDDWRTRVGDLLEIGLPVLVEKIGLPWPVEGEIEVVEVHTPLLEGYAGVFYTDRDLIEISEDLDELTIIHEASHAWFNARLFVGRWINEGFADEYAARVLDEVSVGGLRPDTLTPGSDGAVRLNDWSHPGRIADEETDAREHFGYTASWIVVRDLLDEIGEEQMQAVLAAAEADTTAYIGAGDPEVVAYPTDWRRFLDLLEEVGGSGEALELYRRWVLEPAQEVAIAARERARAAYAELVEAGDGWAPGFAVRDPMGRWQFSAANEQIEAATAVLEIRDEIRAIAGGLGLAAPASLEAAYEGATEDLDETRALADEQLDAAMALEDAAAVVAAERDLLTSLGLVGEDPAAGITAASAAFEADDGEEAVEQAAAVRSLIEGADDAGLTRAAIGGGVVVLGGGLGLAGVMLRRRRDATLGRQRPDEPAAPPPLVETEPPPAGPDRAGGEDS